MNKRAPLFGTYETPGSLDDVAFDAMDRVRNDLPTHASGLALAAALDPHTEAEPSRAAPVIPMLSGATIAGRSLAELLDG